MSADKTSVAEKPVAEHVSSNAQCQRDLLHLRDLLSERAEIREAALARLSFSDFDAATATQAIARAIGDSDEITAYGAFKLFEELCPGFCQQSLELWNRLAESFAEHEIRLAATDELVKLLPTVISWEEIARGEWPKPIMEGAVTDTSAHDRMSALDEFKGHWIAWDDEHRAILASSDSFNGLMRKVEDQGLDNPEIERVPGLLPGVAEKSSELFQGESEDLLEDIKETIPDAEEWLDTPNARLWCQKPRDLIRTPKEEFVRSLLRGIRSGITS